MWKSKSWQHEITGVDGKCQLFGVNIFHYKWEPTGERVDVKDPYDDQSFTFPVYRVNIGGTNYEFAAGEFSNCMWGFYLFRF